MSTRVAPEGERSLPIPEISASLSLFVLRFIGVPDDIADALARHCAEVGEHPSVVATAAVTLYLEAVGAE